MDYFISNIGLSLDVEIIKYIIVMIVKVYGNGVYK